MKKTMTLTRKMRMKKEVTLAMEKRARKETREEARSLVKRVLGRKQEQINQQKISSIQRKDSSSSSSKSRSYYTDWRKRRRRYRSSIDRLKKPRLSRRGSNRSNFIKLSNKRRSKTQNKSYQSLRIIVTFKWRRAPLLSLIPQSSKVKTRTTQYRIKVKQAQGS